MADDATPGVVDADPEVSAADLYRRFARVEAAGRSPSYQRLAEAVAQDRVVLGFLAGLSAEKRQPNLLFAAARYLLDDPLGDALDAARLHALVTARASELAAVMLTRRRQTNEAARCATLLPVLSGLRPPLALLEVGTSAGLTLLADRYSYDYDGHRVPGADPLAPTIPCRLRGPAPIPDTVPTVSWRAGIDLNPLDVEDADDLHWLECLIWPGQRDRLARLRAAAATARRARPRVHRGDLLDDLPRVAAAAPADATPVIFHTAVLAYVDAAKRAAFADTVHELGAVWLSNEAPGVLTGLPPETDQAARDAGGFVLAHDRLPLAITDPHGTWLHWPAPIGTIR